jgi:hypothetical protein
MQAINTKYIGPTNTKGARILVKAQAGKMFVSWDYALNADENHVQAAYKFMNKMDWPNKIVSGGAWDHSEYHVMLPRTEGIRPGYAPSTGIKCHCRLGLERDNCPDCEGSGFRVDFAKIRAIRS